MTKLNKRHVLVALTTGAVALCGVAATELARKTDTKRHGRDITEQAQAATGANLTPDEANVAMAPSAPKAKGIRGARRAPAREAAQDGVSVNFCIMTQAADQKLHEAHAYKVYVDNGDFTYYNLSGSAQPNASKGGVAVDDYYYATQTYGIPIKDWTQKWDMRGETDEDGFTWSYVNTVVNGQYFMFAQDAAYDPWTDRIIGSVTHTYAYSTKTMAVLDYDTQTREFFGPEYQYADQLQSIAAGKDCYYAIGSDNIFYTMDKFTGEITPVGPTGVNASQINIGSMTCDPRTGRIFYSAVDNNRDFLSTFYEIDPTTGAATALWEDPECERRYGLWCDELATMASPETVTGLAANFQTGERQGTIDFTAPSTDREGNAISGTLNYTILGNGHVLATGTAQCGEAVSAPLTIEQDGIYKFSVKTEGETGISRWARITVPVGNTEPAAPEATATFDGSSFTVTWDQVDCNPEGVSLDPAMITYNVVRYPGAVSVAEGTSSLSVTDSPSIGESLTNWYYTVTAVFAGASESQPGQTNVISTGVILPPYSEDWTDRNDFNAYLVVDADNDGNTWMFDDGTYQYPYLYQKPTSNAPNDWVISPAVRLEAGKYYRVTFAVGNLTAPWTTPVTVHMAMGREQNVEALTTDMVTSMDCGGYRFIEVGDYVRVEETGDYYFGLQNISVAGGPYAQMHDFTVSSAVMPEAPGAVENVDVRSSVADASRAIIKFNAPTVTADGSALSSLSRLDVMMDGQPVQSLYNVHPGEQLELSTLVPERGKEYQFSFLAYNEAGAGKLWYNDFFIGIHAPSRPLNIYGCENNGQVTLKWDAPEFDEEGNALNPDYVTYDVRIELADYMVRTVGEDLSSTSVVFDYDLEEEGVPEMIYVSMRAKTEGGSSDWVASIPVAVGPAYSTPWKESFPNGTPQGIYGAISLKGSIQWGLFLDSSFTDITSQDADSGFLGMACQTVGGRGLFAMGKVDLTNCTDPEMSFHVYNIQGGSPDENRVEIWVIDEDGIHVVYNAPNKIHAPYWDKVTFPLGEFAGKTVQICVVCETQSYVYTLVDNFRIAQQMACNLGVKSFEAPRNVQANQEFPLTAVIDNGGNQPAEDYTVSLLLDGEVIDIIEGESIPVGETKTFTFNQVRTVFDDETAEYAVLVEIDGDEDPEDDQSAPAIVNVEYPNLPVPTNVTVTPTGQGREVMVCWDDPDMGDGSLQPMTESFETAQAWSATEANGWLLYDCDGANIGGASNITFPEVQGTAVGFFVLDSSMPQFNESWTPHSGNQMIITMYNQGGVQNDDWAISPELNGKAQTITFWARSYDAGYPETFRLLWSQGGIEPAEFTEIKTVVNASPEWTLYSVEVPETAKRFAINCISTDRFMLFVDDITFIPAGEMNLEGFNLYENQQRINTIPLGQLGNRFYDEVARDGYYDFNVTALIDGMESMPSETCTAYITVAESGVEEAIGQGATVRAVPGAIIFSGLSGQPLMVADATGRVIYRGQADGQLKVAASKGVYAVTIGNRSVKLNVK